MKRKSVILMILLTVLLVFSCSEQEQQSRAAQTTTVSAVTQAAENYFADFPGNRMVKMEDVMAAIDAGDDFVVLDIRRADDYAKGHIKGAVNAPWGPAIADALNWLPDDIPVYVNCYSGQTAGQTVAALNVAGIPAKSIRYGWNLGISKTEGYEAYTDTENVMAPDASGVKFDPEVKAAVEAFFRAIPESGSNIIAAAKLKELMDAEEPMTIVSVRQPDAYTAGHIEGAINIPWGAGMQENFSQLPKDEKVYVYCYSGQTAGQTVGILRLLGYDAVSVKSGMGTGGTGGSGWGVEGFPVVK